MAHGIVIRLWRGTSSILAIPFGRLAVFGDARLSTPQRRARGLVIVLPGMQGKAMFDVQFANGLVDGGWTGAVEIHEWTTGFWPLMLFHKRGLKRNRR